MTSAAATSLVGVELGGPVLGKASRAADVTNEGRVDDRIGYLHNVIGLWLPQECLRTWERAPTAQRLPDLLIAAGERRACLQFDPDDLVFLPPGDIPARIA
ncbi:MAG: hypothetical protein H0V73_06240 [Chloroflexi bacterium]|nr:hypothetical protein [Chloroflexota bacterium]